MSAKYFAHACWNSTASVPIWSLNSALKNCHSKLILSKRSQVLVDTRVNSWKYKLVIFDGIIFWIGPQLHLPSRGDGARRVRRALREGIRTQPLPLLWRAGDLQEEVEHEGPSPSKPEHHQPSARGRSQRDRNSGPRSVQPQSQDAAEARQPGELFLTYKGLFLRETWVCKRAMPALESPKEGKVIVLKVQVPTNSVLTFLMLESDLLENHLLSRSVLKSDLLKSKGKLPASQFTCLKRL